MNIQSLQTIMLSIAEARALEPIFQKIVCGVAEASDVALVRLWLIESDRDCPLCRRQALQNNTDSVALHLRGTTGRSRDKLTNYDHLSGSFHRVPLGERKIGQIAQSGQPLLIPEVTGNEPWVADREWIFSEDIRSFAGQPLIFRGETLGVLAVFSRATLTPAEFDWLRTFADHAAVAIANARAFEQLEQLKGQLQAENEYLNEEIRETLAFGDIIGNSAALRKVLEQVALVAQTDATVLIQGESGTGKELIARAIHERSARRQRPFIKVNCAAIPEDLFESEFFGHVKGAFTGAIRDRLGRFELADSGELFLDEIAEIPLSLQPKLLRVLQEKQFEKVGDVHTRTVDVRIIGATNRDLKKEVEQGRFREDLYYRLTVFPIELPPLRERKEDIPTLAQHFVRKSASRLGVPVPRLRRQDLEHLVKYDWPGNIRELENVIERAVILSRNSPALKFDPLTSNTFPKPSPTKPTLTSSRRILREDELRQQEVANILAALEQAKGKIFGKRGAAELLGMRPTTLASRMKALGLRKSYLPEKG